MWGPARALSTEQRPGSDRAFTAGSGCRAHTWTTLGLPGCEQHPLEPWNCLSQGPGPSWPSVLPWHRNTGKREKQLCSPAATLSVGCSGNVWAQRDTCEGTEGLWDIREGQQRLCSCSALASELSLHREPDPPVLQLCWESFPNTSAAVPVQFGAGHISPPSVCTQSSVVGVGSHGSHCQRVSPHSPALQFLIRVTIPAWVGLEGT